ncbi:MAG: undecaprenyl/decaprenyl-phosphate alpha-N-acetylglucosaminyl 1-phosphate transferase [Phycisphaerales bacterium]|nr:undecaprenyl/decaprenyl-phosphate alpha-N-acetylglucosaminyl 1-phosphate transferase [Phycisphaerales bacterium]
MEMLVLSLVFIGFVIACPATWMLIRISHKVGALDSDPIEGQTKMPTRAIPNTGGIGIAAGILLPMIGALIVFALLDESMFTGVLEPIAKHIDGIKSRSVMGWGVVLCALALHILGVIDDRKPLGAMGKLVIMVLPGLVCATLLDTRLLTVLDAPMGGSWASIVITIIWFVAVTNAMNFMDNMDGLAGGVATIAGAFFLAAALINGQWFVGAMLALLVGSSAGFLVFNFPPAKVFMGDGGSLLIGFLLAFLTTRTTYIADIGTTNSGAWYAVLMPVAVLAVPLYDMVSVVIIRVSQGKSPFVGDLQHLSHRFRDRGISGRSTVLIIYGLTAATGCAGLLLARVQPWQAIVLGGQIAVLLVTLAFFEHRSIVRKTDDG